MNTLIHTITGIGPSRFARYMAGCVTENENQLYKDVEDYETKKLIATSHIDHDVARDLAHNIVSKRKDVDDRYKEKDQQGIEGKGPEFEFTPEGDVRFPEFNECLGEMCERQKAVRPQEYNKEEHDTVISAYQTLRNGAKQAAHIVHHYNEGELDIRDIVILTYDHKTNTGQMHVLNISREGKNHQTLESAREAMKTRLGGFTEEIKTEGVFLFVREEKPIDPVSLFREKTNSEEIHERTVTSLNDYRKEPVREFRTANSVQETMPIIRTVVYADTNKDDVPFRLPLFLQRLMGRDENGAMRQQKKRKEKKHNNIVLRDNGIQEAQNRKSTKETSSVFTRIEKQKEKSDEKKESIIFAQKTGVGVGGALFLLD
ncbi:MAG: hypothetical protein UT57_C0026G0009, partial [Microgenomates group bacterium GW2011_GWC1_39_7]